MTKLMQGKKGIIMGVTNEYSIAYEIAKNLANNGAELAFSFPNEKVEKRVVPIGQELGSNTFLKCDVTNSQDIENVFLELEKKWGKIDFVVHSIAFADKNELQGRYVDTSLANFLNTMHVSCFSFTEIMKHAGKILNVGGSAVTLTYYGAQKTLPNYNVMGVAKAALEASVRYLAEDFGKQGVRVNAISAGPIKTLAASGIGDFNYILKWNSQNSPLRRNVSQQEVGKSALYLLSDLASGVTGEIHFVDAGYNVVGMKAVDAEDLVKS